MVKVRRKMDECKHGLMLEERQLKVCSLNSLLLLEYFVFLSFSFHLERIEMS